MFVVILDGTTRLIGNTQISLLKLPLHFFAIQHGQRNNYGGGPNRNRARGHDRKYLRLSQCHSYNVLFSTMPSSTTMENGLRRVPLTGLSKSSMSLTANRASREDRPSKGESPSLQVFIPLY